MENGGHMMTGEGGDAYVTRREHDDASCSQSPVVQAVEDLGREFRCSIWYVFLSCW